MKTSVNSDTWISIGIRMPTTASDEPLETMIAASTIATMNSSMPSAADRVREHRANRPARPTCKAEPGGVLDQRRDDGKRGQRHGDAAMGQKILAIVQPGIS